MAMNESRAASEDKVIGEALRGRNGGGKDNGVNVKCPLDVTGN